MDEEIAAHHIHAVMGAGHGESACELAGFVGQILIGACRAWDSVMSVSG